MRELYNYIDYKSRDAAEKNRITFDKSAWDKMESLLDKEAVVPNTQMVSNPFVANKDTCKNRNGYYYLQGFLLQGLQ